ncbi:MAG: ABC transporter substrate-binding protein [Nitrospirae bacterium]|nr:ABC transporter substrate-binding protein [Nitrospirota bacterium]
MNVQRLFYLTFLFFLFHPLPFHFLYAEPPKRIISLAPNLTEILFESGLGNRVIGVTTFCDYPEEAKKIAKIGGMSNPSLEAVVRLKPDIVVMTTDGNTKDFANRIQSLNIKTYVFKARRLSELPGAIRDMCSVLNCAPEGYSLAEKIENYINNASLEMRNKNKSSLQKNVLFIVWPEPLIVAGPGTAINEAINLLGSKNIAEKAKTAYPKYSVEEIIRQSPDVIIIGKGHENMKVVSTKLIMRLKNIPAVKNNKVFYISDSLYRLGPRVINGIEELKTCLQ